MRSALSSSFFAQERRRSLVALEYVLVIFQEKSFVEAKLINCNFHGLDRATIFFQETRGVGGIKKIRTKVHI
jgi:hypothetical protein